MGRATGKSLIITTEVAATPTTVGFQTEATISMSRDPVDVTAKSDDWATFLAGDFGNWTVEGSSHFDPSDTTHDQMWTDISTGATSEITVTDGTETYSGEAFVTSWQIEGSQESPIGLSYSLQGSGALTKS